MKERPCFILWRRNYNGENSMSVFVDEALAKKEMLKELEIEKIKLLNGDYNFGIIEYERKITLFTYDDDEYEWNIFESTIQ